LAAQEGAVAAAEASVEDAPRGFRVTLDDDVPRALSREQTTQLAPYSACSTSNDDDFILNFQLLSPDTDR
jgi:hypothetical protein